MPVEKKKIAQNMNVKEYAKQQAKRIADALQIKQHADRINMQVEKILALIDEGATLQITRFNCDPDLYEALLDAKVVSDNTWGSDVKAATSISNFKQQQQQQQQSSTTAASKKVRVTFKQPEQTLSTEKLDARKFDSNARRLHELVNILEQDDMDEALRLQYEAENSFIEKEQIVLKKRLGGGVSSGGGGGGGIIVAPTPAPTQSLNTEIKKRTSPPSQEANHRNAKKPRKGVARTRLFIEEEEALGDGGVGSSSSRNTTTAASQRSAGQHQQRFRGSDFDEDVDVDDKLVAPNDDEDQQEEEEEEEEQDSDK